MLEASFPFLFGYFLGAIPFGWLIAQRVARIDLTQAGSQNIGATNVTRIMGLRWGILTFLLDFLKGFLFVLWTQNAALSASDGVRFVLILAPVLGHCTSVFMKGKGGKGVATALGVFAVLSPLGAILSGLVFLWVFLMKKVGSLASLSAILFFLIWSTLGVQKWGLDKIPLAPVLFLSFLVLVKHLPNLRDLVRGQERGFSFVFLLWGLFSLQAQGETALKTGKSGQDQEFTSLEQKRVSSPSPQKLVALAPALASWVLSMRGESHRIVGLASPEFSAVEELRKIPSVGGMNQIQVEKIVHLKPDLVLATTDGNSKTQIESLKKLGLEVMVFSTDSIEDWKSSWKRLAQRLGDSGAMKPSSSQKVALDQRTEVLDQALMRLQNCAWPTANRGSKSLQGRWKAAIEIYADPLILASGSSFLGQILQWMGIENYWKGNEKYPRPKKEVILKDPPQEVLVLSGMRSAELKDVQRLSGEREKQWRVWAPSLQGFIFSNSVHLHQPTLQMLEEMIPICDQIRKKREEALAVSPAST